MSDWKRIIVHCSDSDFGSAAENKGITKEQAFEDALAEYIKKNSKIDIEKMMEGT